MASILSVLVAMLGICMVSSQMMSLFGGEGAPQVDPMLYLAATSGPGPNDIMSVQMRISMAQMKAKMMANWMGQPNNPQTVKMFTLQELRKQAHSAQQSGTSAGQQAGFGSMMPSVGTMDPMTMMMLTGNGGGANMGSMAGMAAMMSAMGVPA